MDMRQAHLVTLWCAVLAKTEKAVTSALPRGVTLMQFRVLAQLSREETRLASAGRLSRALVARPSEVRAALFSLGERGLVGAQDASGGVLFPDDGDVEGFFGRGAAFEFFVTDEGQRVSADACALVIAFHQRCLTYLDDEDCALWTLMMTRALTCPGSFYATRKLSTSEVMASPTYCTTALFMMQQAISTAVKSTTGMSFTDFRFLLELYPKRRGVAKRLRAREIVRCLRTGRSYVTTASVRLGGAGLIKRIPDDRDARGVLFELTLAGTSLVREAGDDVLAVLVSLFGGSVDDQRFAHALKGLLRGIDEVMEEGV